MNLVRTSKHLRRTWHGRVAVFASVAMVVATLAACGSSAPRSSSPERTSTDDISVLMDGALPRFPEGTTLRVVTHDSFAVSSAVLDEFTAATGVKVEVLNQGDAGTMVNASILTKDDPQGDLLFGIDENLLTAAFDAGLFRSYNAAGLSTVAPSYLVDDQHRVTPIDHGEVCVNFDRGWFISHAQPVPQRLEDLESTSTKDLLAVEDPSASTPGLAFLLATIAHFGGGEDIGSNPPWLDYWRSLKANGVSVVDSWESAYYSSFSGSTGKGDRPLVVSYSSSPPAEVSDTTSAVDQTPTGVVADTCFRQIEFAGVFANAKNPRAAEAFIEFMLGTSFQQDMPAQMYVYPVVSGTQLPEVFEKYTTRIAEPFTLPFDEVAANRERWITQWASVFR